MKTLELNEMVLIEGRASSCATAAVGLFVAVGSAFFGPAGIVSGLAGFAVFVNNAGDCEKEMDSWW